MDFDYYDELKKFVTNFPFIFTANNDFSDTDYVDHFVVKKDCRHTYRFPFVMNPAALVTDLRTKIVQTYSKATPQGTLANITLIQLSPQEHLSVVYSEADDRFVASVAVYVTDARKIPDLQNEFEKYKFDDKKRKIGFGGHDYD